MERSRSKDTWLFDKQEIVDAFGAVIDHKVAMQAIDDYIEEQTYIARMLAGSSIIEEFDKHAALVREGGIAYGTDYIVRAARIYLETASQADYDDYLSVEFHTLATQLVDDTERGLEAALPILEDLRQDLVAQGFAFDNMDEGENHNVSTD